MDDIYRSFEAKVQEQQLPAGRRRGPQPSLTTSEIMMVMIHFHQAGYRDFKSYYQKHVLTYLRQEFPGLASYNRFVELVPRVLLALIAYLQSRFGSCTGIAFVDSTPIMVCHNRRIARHKVFKGLAARGKSTMGWFYGFKLHLIVNEQGELLAVQLTPGNVDDRKTLPRMSKALFGKLFGDKGYLSQALFEELYERGLELITINLEVLNLLKLRHSGLRLNLKQPGNAQRSSQRRKATLERVKFQSYVGFRSSPTVLCESYVHDHST